MISLISCILPKILLHTVMRKKEMGEMSSAHTRHEELVQNCTKNLNARDTSRTEQWMRC
jgi:hypothetical protein